ncbi:MAG: SurA N-terminal domain-containing protein [Deltaproteobacteria bacterium]|nr:MAG: SurA N-terminal domain-containing protein [Deltaproteobacteria bacterium]
MKISTMIIYWVSLLLAAIALVGCFGTKSEEEDTYLIRVGDHVVTVLDFNKAFEIAKTAYTHNVMQKPGAFREAQIRLLNQMTEELILLQRAKELNISVSEQEVEKSIAEIKGDYPDDVFEQTLLEYAVSYQSWKEGVKVRLLMEKLVEMELKDQIVITADDIEKYYEENYKGDGLQTEFAEKSKDINEKIIKHLRRKKTEKAYKEWIERMQKRYEIEINKEQWERIISS